MPSRRYHTKTRHGCVTCKARKVRCDEEKPICQNCTRGNRACSYPTQLLDIPNGLINSSADTKEHIFPIRDMELLHHYTATSYRMMSPEEDEYLHIWQIRVPRLAFSNRFLLHGLLATAALHLSFEADESEKETLMNVARYHHHQGLILYIPLLREINQENCDALFGFSLILGVFLFGSLHEDCDSPKSLIGQFLDIFDALMGATAVASEAGNRLLEGEFRELMVALQVRDARDFTDIDSEAKAALQALLGLAVDGSVAESTAKEADWRRTAYLKSIAAVSTVLSTAPGKRQLSIVVSWPVMAEADYLVLLKRRDPLALIILAHYGVALHLYGRLWMLEGLGRRLVDAILEELGETWRPHMEWARRRVTEPISESTTPHGDSVSAARAS